MKSASYIEWNNLKNIPFFLCQVVEDEENKDIDIYYLGERVLHDYDHVGHYMRSAIILFRRIKNRTADWVNLQNLWTLRNCIRENYNHGIGVDSLIYGEDFDGMNPETLTPLTKKRFDLIVKRIKELDKYATIQPCTKYADARSPRQVTPPEASYLYFRTYFLYCIDKP